MPPELLEQLRAGTQQQVVGVGEQHLRAALEQILATLTTHRGMGTDRHEGRRQHFVVRGAKSTRAGARPGSGGFKFEMQAGHRRMIQAMSFADLKMPLPRVPRR